MCFFFLFVLFFSLASFSEVLSFLFPICKKSHNHYSSKILILPVPIPDEEKKLS